MNTIVRDPRAMQGRNALVALIMSLMLALCALSLTGCGGASAEEQGSASAQEQDNCYGEDMPVINE